VEHFQVFNLNFSDMKKAFFSAVLYLEMNCIDFSKYDLFYYAQSKWRPHSNLVAFELQLIIYATLNLPKHV
jgi:hypothetical protein